MARPPSKDQWADAPRVFLAGIVATGLAAALGAVLTSVVGVQGTVAGAMLGAMIVSGLSQVVRLPLARLERWLIQVGIIAVRRKRPLRRAPSAGALPASSDAPTRPRGKGALVIGVLGFLLGLAVISGFEIVQGKPLSATTRHQEETGTTIGHLVQNQRPGGAPQTPAPAADEPTQAAAAPAVSPVPTSRLDVGSSATGSASSPAVVSQPTAAASPTRLLPTPTPLSLAATPAPRGQTPVATATLAAPGPAPATPAPTPSPPRPSASPPPAATATGTIRPS